MFHFAMYPFLWVLFFGITKANFWDEFFNPRLSHAPKFDGKMEINSENLMACKGINSLIWIKSLMSPTFLDLWSVLGILIVTDTQTFLLYLMNGLKYNCFYGTQTNGSLRKTFTGILKMVYLLMV